MIGVVERLPGRRIAGIGLAADEIGLPRRHGRDAGHASISHWVETGLVVSGVEATSIRSTCPDDQILGDFGGAVRIGLAVLDDDLDR
jgi:hypothetical protein